MRVVQVLTQGAGGPVDHAVDVASVLARRGVESHVLGPAGPAAARARAAGVVWHDVHVGAKQDLGGAARAVRTLRALRPTVTHLQDRRAGWLGRLLGPALPGGLVYTLHGVPDGLSDLVAGNALAGPRRRRDRLYYLHGERAVTRWSRCRVVVPSHAVAAYAEQHIGLPPVDVVPNGVDVDRFVPREGSTAGPVTAIWLGLLGEVKRPGVLLDAVAAVPDLHLRLVGDGPLAASVRARVASLGLQDRVELLGAVADPRDLLRGADLFVLTSAAENLPLAMLQAMACGLPVVAGAVGGIPEVVRTGRDGVLVAVDDHTALIDALARLTAQADTRRSWGRSARARVVADFALEDCVNRLVEVYAASADERGRARTPAATTGGGGRR